MKFSEMPYARPDLNELKQQLQSLTDRLKAAPDYAAAREAFLAQQKLSMHIDTLATLSSVRNSIDTRDKFYDAEEEFWNEAGPELRAYDDAWTAAMLESPFRKVRITKRARCMVTTMYGNTCFGETGTPANAAELIQPRKKRSGFTSTIWRAGR